MDEQCIGVLGATSLVGECLLPVLAQTGSQVVAFSRREHGQLDGSVEWRRLFQTSSPSPVAPFPPGERPMHAGLNPETSSLSLSRPFGPPSPASGRGEIDAVSNRRILGGGIQHWICVTPIWVLPDYFGLLEAHGALRLVALSSTSRFTKDDSSDPEEQAVARRLADAEMRVRDWAESKGVEWVILRPTLIYGRGRDKNISEMARFIRRFGFFPVFGRANGLRQPVHAEDVAGACVAALKADTTKNRAYNLSGGETLSYREMTARVFAALGRKPRLLRIPLVLFWLALTCVRWVPRYRHWSVAMAERMNRDLLFDHTNAAEDLGFSPRQFLLSTNDLPV